jgi:hypothetical protein
MYYLYSGKGRPDCVEIMLCTKWFIVDILCLVTMKGEVNNDYYMVSVFIVTTDFVVFTVTGDVPKHCTAMGPARLYTQ